MTGANGFSANMKMGEYVLGLLSEAEAAEIAHRIAQDAELAALEGAWIDVVSGTLDVDWTGRAPHLLPAIERRLFGAPQRKRAMGVGPFGLVMALLAILILKALVMIDIFSIW
ncbi:hypothetical protein [Roseovarius aquimarinus]|uniref:Uncharacterized protein n=1 Tax=Roseovarius aquimarinus TaxID=1229156 RepID=A0ABW7I641_9RHOB